MPYSNRKYYHSSSFKMAVLFTIILGLSAIILGYFIYSYSKGEYISEDKVAISAEIYNQILCLGGVSIFLMFLVAVISFFLSVFVVNRINIIAKTAGKIMVTGDLSGRISIDNKWDDLSNLSFVLNEMLETIENLVSDVKQVSDNIAHDLRTPLARLRNDLENFKLTTENPKLANKLIKEADNLLQTFNAILRISNIEKGKRLSNFELTNLENLIYDVIELYEPIAQEKSIKINSNLLSINFLADKDLLFQALANIIDNSIKFTPENGVIGINLSHDKTNIYIAISDTGIGVNDFEKEKIFDRFYRTEASRTSKGNGLGLSLVKAVINLHKGKISVADNIPNGLVTKIQLPKN
ncbi:MAG: HAMP domain-containing sensor histidine kinase [Rickettsiales bacterium]|nr:HAMP domain-containing sensor histidine kinase [Rickettsiales bacterium]